MNRRDAETQSFGKTEIEKAWAKEALERSKAYHEGKITARDSKDVMCDAYKRVK